MCVRACVRACVCVPVFLKMSENLKLSFIDHHLSGSKKSKNEKYGCKDGKTLQIFIENSTHARIDYIVNHALGTNTALCRASKIDVNKDEYV